MAHPVLWPKRTFYYPIGNTSAVSLTETLPPEESGDILLLGCGDPRNILFTIHSDTTLAPRKLDFTCCDAEPAVLARNILLFTMIIDNDIGSTIMADMIWNIFYHFFLDKPSLDLLLGQCRKLVEMSATLDTWNSCQYAPFLRVCTHRTLFEVRRHWTLYIDTDTLPLREKKELKKQFISSSKSSSKKHQNVLSASRSAGPFSLPAVSIVSENFRQYWETGATFLDLKHTTDAILVNPTFAYSVVGRGFSLHYGTDPIAGFHLSVAFAEAKTTSTITSAHLANTAKQQFHEWSHSFRKSLTRHSTVPRIVIRFFTGDALAFCRALHHRTVHNSITCDIFTGAWTHSKLELDGGDYLPNAEAPAPTIFNVIDTSNLTDHLGLVNILIVASPLLARTPSSVLHTDTLVRSYDDPITTFNDRLCADIPVISLLLDIAPLAYIAGFMTHSNAHERFMSTIGSRQSHERIKWKILSLADPLADSGADRRCAFDPQELARLLFGIYRRMFSDEDMLSKMQNLSLESLSKSSIIHYIRGSFAALLCLIKQRTRTNWEKTMGHLDDLIVYDRTLLTGPNNYQDLFSQLHLLRIYSTTVLAQWPAQKSAHHNLMNSPFARWKEVPSLVCVVLVVPRQNIKVLEEMDVEDIGTPILQGEVLLVKSSGHNIFSSIQTSFGEVRQVGPPDEPRCELTECRDGLSGKAALIASFLVPSWVFVMEPQYTKIKLSICPTLATLRSIAPKLGMEMCLCEAFLMDNQYVHVFPERPNFSGQPTTTIPSISTRPPSSQANATSAMDSNSTVVSLDEACRTIACLCIRCAVISQSAQVALSGGATVSARSISPYAVQIAFGSFEHVAIFPLPMDATRLKTRIARKSLYVELEAPPSGPFDPISLLHNKFPVTIRKGIPTVWNMHYLRLDSLPPVRSMNASKVEDMSVHLSLMSSDREERLLKSASNTLSTGDVILDVKQSLKNIFAIAVQPVKTQIIGLAEPSCGGIYTLIFINYLRLDLSSHSIVVDVSILPVTNEMRPTLDAILRRITPRHSLTSVVTIGDEVKAWKRLLPVLVERCRDWKHLNGCEYIKQGSIPLSVEFAETPICSCGQGQSTDSFTQARKCQEIVPLVTRAAIGPIFAASFIEPVETSRLDKLSKAVPDFKDSRIPGQCARCGGSGKPKLLLCSKCRKTSYCSRECQKEDWRAHKSRCRT